VTQRTAELSAALQAKLALESFAQLMSDHQTSLLAYWTRDLRLAFANQAFIDWFGAGCLIGRSYGECWEWRRTSSASHRWSVCWPARRRDEFD
jgi:hypothetical protein